jgi:hypothetical protein
MVLACDPRRLQQRVRPHPKIPLRGLCDLCAMLSAVVLARDPRRRQQSFRPHPIPFVAAVTSVRCFPRVVLERDHLKHTRSLSGRCWTIR